MTTDRRKDPEYVRLIKSNKWRNTRRCYLTAHPVCERCAEKGRTSLAVEVHHITPISHGRNYDQKRALAYNPGNLMALCHDCHESIHQEMGSGWYGRKSRSDIRKRAEATAKSFAETWLVKH